MLPKPALAMLLLPVYTVTAGHRGTRSSVFLSLHCIDQYGLCSRSGSANVIAFCCKISKCMGAENETDCENCEENICIYEYLNRYL